MKIRIGTRASNLAMIQANGIRDLIETNTDHEVEVIKISTEGDRVLDRPIEALSQSGVFVREIEQALLDHRIDVAVHSLKDMPSDIDPRLTFTAPPACEEDVDVFIGREDIRKMEDLRGKTIGTGSNRRIAQLKAYDETITARNIRGNIETRIRKIEEEHLDGIILAKAGIMRAGYENRINFELNPNIFLTSPCQGILGIEIRREDMELEELFFTLSDPVTREKMGVERTFQKELSATCTSPIGILTEISEDHIILEACYAPNKEMPLVYERIEGKREDGMTLAKTLAQNLRGKHRG